MEEEKLYKVLSKEGTACNGGDVAYNLPRKRADGSWRPGEWMPPITGKLEPCANGYHLCREKDLIYWLGETIFEAEYRDEKVEDEDKIVVRQCRLLRKCEGWNERTARLFACWCVRNTPLQNGGTVWDLLEDERSRNAVVVAEKFAKGEIAEAYLNIAHSAAGDAARDITHAAARDAAEAAAREDAGDAARTAAWAAMVAAGDAAWAAMVAAAMDAARAAAWTAARAAVEAAGDATWAAAREDADAAWYAARAAARAAQKEELCTYLECRCC